MDSIRRNRQIDSLKFLLLKCQDGNSLVSTTSSQEESTFSTEAESPTDASNKGGGGEAYEDQLLNQLSGFSETRSRLQAAVLLSDACRLTDSDRRLPGATVLSELIADVDQLGSRLSYIGENMELLGWRLLQNRFTTGLDLPYDQHGAVKSLLRQMAALISDSSNIEMSFQKAAKYKPTRKLGEHLTGAGRELCELRARLENIKTLRQNCRPGHPADVTSTAAISALGLRYSELTDSVFSHGSA